MAGKEGFQRKLVEIIRPVEEGRSNVVRLPQKSDERPKRKREKSHGRPSKLTVLANRDKPWVHTDSPLRASTGVLSKAYRQTIDDGPTKREQREIQRLKKLGFTPRKSPAEKALLKARSMVSAFALGMMGGTTALSEGIASLDAEQLAAVKARTAHIEELRGQWDTYRERYSVPPGGRMLTLEEASPRLAELVRSQGGAVTLGNLFVPFLGSSGPSIRLREGEPLSHYDPAAVLENLWNMKCMIAPNARMNAEHAVGGYRRLQTQGRVWRSTIDAQIEGANNPSHTGESVTAIIAAQLNWSALQHEYHLSDTQRELLQSVTALMSPQDIYSIFLTELMPSDNGLINIAVADTMLRHGGEGELVRLTSLGDSLNSSTPGQFTFYSFTEWAGIPRVGPLLSDKGYRLLQIPKGAAVHRMPDGQLLTNDADIKFGNDLATSADQIESIRETEVDVMFNGIGNLANSINSPSVQHFLTQFTHGEVSEREFAVFFGMMHHEPSIALAAVAALYRHHRSSLYEAVPENDHSNMRDYILRMRGNYDALSSMRPARDSFAERLRHPPEPLLHQ